MTAYIVRRLILAIIVFFIVSLMIFFGMRLLPGDPILMLLTSSQERTYTDEEIAQIRHENGLDKPLLVQYFEWMGGVLHGDLGTSIIEHTPVSREILRRIPITFHLGVVAFIFGNIIGILAGIICAVRRGSWIDTVVTTLANIGITMPSFWLAIMLMYFFGLYLRWLPIMGYTSPFDDFWLSTRQLVMPVTCLSIGIIAGNARQVRSSMLEVMHQDYIRTAWSKGLGERIVIIKHAMKNALIPIITLAGMGVGMLIGGSVFIETVFNIPGIGRLAVNAVNSQDYPYVQAVTLLITVVVVLSNLAVDLIYGWADPRIRFNE